jgi:hypothetical protein
MSDLTLAAGSGAQRERPGLRAGKPVARIGAGIQMLPNSMKVLRVSGWKRSSGRSPSRKVAPEPRRDAGDVIVGYRCRAATMPLPLHAPRRPARPVVGGSYYALHLSKKPPDSSNDAVVSLIRGQ